MTDVPPRPGLYLHVPFCSSICPYCDFAARRGGERLRQRFVDALLAEMALAAPAWPHSEPFDTVYFGGGTPSLLSSEQLARLLASCREHFALHPSGPWVFLEANPEDVTPAACEVWRQLGVRTVSLGVQSFSDESLRFLGRRHTAAQARAAVETALQAGFHTVSVDLIFGLPGQGTEAWRRDLAQVVALSPDHISCYQLTIHPRTILGVRKARGQLAELSEDEQASMFELTHRFLADAGWLAYEVSNFARDLQHRSLHNRKYWEHMPYLGLGPSAHSLAWSVPPSLWRQSRVAARRFWNAADFFIWERRLLGGERPLAGEEDLGIEELAAEALLLGLRTTAGLDLEEFATRFGLDLLAANEALLARLAEERRVEVVSAPSGRRLRPTVQGLAVADGLAAAFRLPFAPAERW